MPTLFVTAPSSVAAELARRLVEERLAAGVDRTACDSVYRWDGDVVAADQELLVVHTSEAACDRCRDRILELHPHEVPCVERYDPTDVHPPFAAWLDEATAASGTNGGARNEEETEESADGGHRAGEDADADAP